jgi:hypothetical protein
MHDMPTVEEAEFVTNSSPVFAARMDHRAWTVCD